MNLINKLFGKKEKPIKSNEDFWNWFQENADQFLTVVKQHQNIGKEFFDKLSPKLNELKIGFGVVAGMYDDQTAELIISADGIVKNIVFVEDLVRSAPQIKGWKITGLKPAMDISDVSIKMEGYEFNSRKLNFYWNDHPDYPDRIDITVVHDDLGLDNKAAIMSGTYIFLDNYLGELNLATAIDNLTIIGKNEIQKELVPIEKLKDFLIWRQKEFVEKYDEARYETENDIYSGLEATLTNGKPLLAIINTDLLKWEAKVSHPWIVDVEVKFDGRKNKGLPADEETLDLLNSIEEKILSELKAFEGYLDIGRETADGKRNLFYACKDFRKPSKVLYQIQNQYADRIEICFDIYKDKYWHSFNRFKSN